MRSHLGPAGDCAIAEIDQREVDPEILELKVKVSGIAEPELGDSVVKSGRTTAVTYGIVSRVHVTVKLGYGLAGVHHIGGFEYTPDPKHPPVNGEVSMGGDSGSAVMLAKARKATDQIVGIHFAGEVGDAPEHGIACYATSVFEKLEISPTRGRHNIQVEVHHGPGFDENFLSIPCKQPIPTNQSGWNTLLRHNGERVFDYTHFSLTLHKERKFASWVAWNIDGNRLFLAKSE